MSTQPNFTKDDIKGYECKHAVYVPARYPGGDDIIFIKERVHLKDGSTVPSSRILKNFERDFYITKEAFRNHKDKKEWEDIDKLQRFTSTQEGLPKAIARALGNPGLNGNVRRLARSPFLYGADITTPTIIKHKYRTTYPDCLSDNSVAVLDIETDVVEGHGRPIYVGITFKDKAFLAVTEEFIGTIPNPSEKLYAAFEKYLGKYKEERGIKLEVLITKTAGEACAEAIKRAHQWKPDFLTIWNIDFDIPKIAETLLSHGYDLAEVFSDPSVPHEFKYFSYKEGKKQKVTASGNITPIHPAERWHVVECPASFFLIDSMCVYRRIRLAKQMEASYSLDEQLNKHLGLRKLKFEEANDYSGLEWHVVMQSDYKIEYGIYNLFDCIGVELFDEKVKDLSQTITVLSGFSEYTIFNSQPRRLIDQLYYVCLEENKVIATCSDEMVDELDAYVYSMKDWVVTLPSHQVADVGLPVIRELPNLRTKVFAHVADADLSAAYPSGQILLNMSKETTYRELSRIKGIAEEVQRMAGINLTGGAVNSVEICCDIFKAPTFDQLLNEFQKAN